MTHGQAVRSALQMNDGMALLERRLGGALYPRGSVMVAYRRALRELRDILNSGGAGPAWRSVRVAEAGEVLRRLRMEVALAVTGVFDDAVTLGSHQAAAQLAGYGVGNASAARSMTEDGRAEALAAVLAAVDAQIETATALLVTGASPEQIVGNDEQTGPLAPAAVLSSAYFWVAALAIGAWTWMVTRPGQPGQPVFLKQAVAAIDERTTDCCLRVHGQVVALDAEFHTTGRPRFAEYQQGPPFHWRCRTAMALVRPEDADDLLTQQMTAAARDELRARDATGKRVVIHPAHARSRRR